MNFVLNYLVICISHDLLQSVLIAYSVDHMIETLKHQVIVGNS
jgi:hypothetical protein